MYISTSSFGLLEVVYMPLNMWNNPESAKQIQFSAIFFKCSFIDIMYFLVHFFYVLEGRGCGQTGVDGAGEYKQLQDWIVARKPF